MQKQLAIHHREGSYSDHWIAFCDSHTIPYKIVDCLASTIMHQLASVNYLLWHWTHENPTEQMVARHVIMAVEGMGIKVFPSVATCWHYDDKVAQKYLLESINAPLVPTHVFYNISEAFRWVNKASYPKVFKLRRGAGSMNVRLVHSPSVAKTLVKQAFNGGFRPIPGYMYDVGKRYRGARQRGDWLGILMRIPKILGRIREINRAMGREKNYIYFQDFIPNNLFDTRVTIIGNRAFGFTRNTRPRDFRASGSGNIIYDMERIHPQCIKTAFEVTRKLGSQSMAFDFVLSENKLPVILEISYCYDSQAVHMCPGYWDDQLKWHEIHMWPQEAILMDLIN